MRALLASAVMLVVVGRTTLAGACSPPPPAPSCSGLQMETGVSVPIDATRDPLVYVPKTANPATLQLLRKADRSQVRFTLVEAPAKSEPQIYFLAPVDRQPGDYVVTGVDPCVLATDIGTFTLTPSVRRPVTLGSIVAERQPTLDVKESRGIGGDCSTIYANGWATKTDVTLTVDPSELPWVHVSSVGVLVDGQPVGFSGPDPTRSLRDGSGIVKVSLDTRCGGDAEFMAGRASVASGNHTIKLSAVVDGNGPSPSEISTNEVAVAIACESHADFGDDPATVVGGDGARRAASGCATSPSRTDTPRIAGLLVLAFAVVTALRRRPRA